MKDFDDAGHADESGVNDDVNDDGDDNGDYNDDDGDDDDHHDMKMMALSVFCWDADHAPSDFEIF